MGAEWGGCCTTRKERPVRIDWSVSGESDEVVCSKFGCILKVKPAVSADAEWRMAMSEMTAGARGNTLL